VTPPIIGSGILLVKRLLLPIPGFSKGTPGTHPGFLSQACGKTILSGPFHPYYPYLCPRCAGVGRMHYAYFITYNFIGGIIWTGLFIFAGYFFVTFPLCRRTSPWW